MEPLVLIRAGPVPTFSSKPPPPPILEAPSRRSNMKDVLEAHGLVLSPKFRIFFKINQFSSEHMYPIRKINN